MFIIPRKIKKARKPRGADERRPNRQRHLTTRKRKGAHRGLVQALIAREDRRRHGKRLRTATTSS